MLAWSAAALGLEVPLPAAARESYLIGDQSDGDSAPQGLARLWRSGESLAAREYPLPFLPHAFTANPFRPHIVFTSQESGNQAAVLDLLKGEVKALQTSPGRTFCGHSIWHPNGLWVFAAQIVNDSGEGEIAVFSTSDWSLTAQFKTGGAYPHDLQFERGSPWLVILNSRLKKSPAYGQRKDKTDTSALVWMNIRGGQIVKRLPLGNLRGGYNHFIQSQDRSLILTGSEAIDAKTSRPMMAIANAAGVVKELKPRKKSAPWSGEALNLAVHENRKLVAATFPNSGSLHVWNLETGVHVSSQRVREPRGLLPSANCCNGGGFIVSSAADRQWLALDKDFKLLEAVKATAAGRGSHAIRIAI